MKVDFYYGYEKAKTEILGRQLMSYNVTLESAPGSLLMECEGPQVLQIIATSADYMEFVQAPFGVDNVRCRKTFGEYGLLKINRFHGVRQHGFVKSCPKAAELMKDCSLSFLMTVPRAPCSRHRGRRAF